MAAPTRLTEPARTSPMAKTPGRLASSDGLPGRAPGDVPATALPLAPDEAVVVRVGDAPLPELPPPAS